MVHLLEDCNVCAIHAKRVTISESLAEIVTATCCMILLCFSNISLGC